MFSPISALSVLALALLAVATPAPNNAKRWATPPTTTVTVTAPASKPTNAGSCNTGAIQCCESTEAASSAAGTALLGLAGVVVQGLDVLLGANCSPITVIGATDGSCSASPVCCENNSFGSLVSIGCVPITL